MTDVPQKFFWWTNCHSLLCILPRWWDPACVRTSGHSLNMSCMTSCKGTHNNITDHNSPSNVAVTVGRGSDTVSSNISLLSCGKKLHSTRRMRCGRPSFNAQLHTTSSFTFSKAVARCTINEAPPSASRPASLTSPVNFEQRVPSRNFSSTYGLGARIKVTANPRFH